MLSGETCMPLHVYVGFEWVLQLLPQSKMCMFRLIGDSSNVRVIGLSVGPVTETGDLSSVYSTQWNKPCCMFYVLCFTLLSRTPSVVLPAVNHVC